MSGDILVINPNSNQTVTAGIDRALAPLRFAGGPGLRCATLAEGPRGIESQRDADSVIGPLCRLAESDNEAGAFVIACFSDPGLHALREATGRPVLGIAECGILTALTRGERFGVIAILPGSVSRHLRFIRAMGLDSRFAGDRPVGLGVGDLAAGDAVLNRMTEVGETLRDQDGADVLVMGCAGMADHRAALQERLGLPVIEPCQAAATMAIGRVAIH